MQDTDETVNEIMNFINEKVRELDSDDFETVLNEVRDQIDSQLDAFYSDNSSDENEE